jgi:hypothetical protein
MISMKRLSFFLVLFLLLFLVSAGFSWIHRDGLRREPGDGAYPLSMPMSAFPMPDGGFAIVDSGSERIVRFNAAGQIRWEILPRTLFGRFLAVDAAPDGMLYCIDEIPVSGDAASGTPVISQRLVRIGLDGSLAAVLLERRAAAGSGFVPGSLRVQDGVLWYLYDEGDEVALASLDAATLDEQVSVRSNWVLDRASLAPGGPGGAVAVAAGGGLALFQRERFETLSEYAPNLPYPACIRYDGNGRLYVSDPVAGVILRIVPGLEPEAILSLPDASSSSTPASGRTAALDNFTLGPEGLVLVDRQASSVLVFDIDAVDAEGTVRLVRELSGFYLQDHEVRRTWLAWMLLAGSLASGMVFLVLLVCQLVFHAPRPLAVMGAALPGLLGMAAVLAVAWYAGMLVRQSTAEAAGLERLRAAVVAGAGALSGLELYGSGTPAGTSPGILADASAGGAAGALHPRGSAGWDALRQRLALMVDQPADDGWPPVSAVLYLESGGSHRYIGDSDGLHVPGMAPGTVPASFRVAGSTHRPAVGMVDHGGARWLSAVAPLAVPAGGPAILLEMASPVRGPAPGWLQRIMSRSVPEPGLLLASFIIAAAAFLGLPLVVIRGREAEELKACRVRLSAIEDKRRAVAALRAGKADEARLILEKVVEGNPLDLQARNNLGAAYVRLGMLEEARACFDAVVQAQPGNMAAKANLERLKVRLARQRTVSRAKGW